MAESVYLAGPITGLSVAEAIGWRKEATERLGDLGYEVYSPMRDKNHLGGVFGDEPLPHTHRALLDPFVRDRQDIWRSDYVLANLLQADVPSVGTCVELGMARAWHKFVVLVVRAEHLHPFLRGCADLVVSTLDDAYIWLAHLRSVRP